MDYELFNKIVAEHRNSLVLMGALTLTFILIGILIIEFYVQRSLGCKFFKIGKLKFSPTWLMIIPAMAVLIFYPIKIYECNADIKESAYTEYIGNVEYAAPSVKFLDKDLSIFVGKGHEIVPAGKNYGKVIYSKRSKVIVYYTSIDK